MAESGSPLKTAEHQTMLPVAQQDEDSARSGEEEKVGSEPLSPDGPTYRELKQHSAALQNNLKELKDNYHVIEHQIHSETQKQRDNQRERYSLVLDRISQLKKMLKIEVEQRKNAELNFKELIETKSEQILNKFTVEYLNKLNQMQDQVLGFTQRKAKLDQSIQELKQQVTGTLSQQKEDINARLSDQRFQFETAYRVSVEEDIKSLKSLGDLQYNFEQMASQICQKRQHECDQIQSLIATTLQQENLYEKEKSTKSLLLAQVTDLKSALKIEIESRRIADEEISDSLAQYQQIIACEVTKKRAEVIQKQQQSASGQNQQ